MTDPVVSYSALIATVEADTDVTTSATQAVHGVNQIIQDLKEEVASLVGQSTDAAATLVIVEGVVLAVAAASDAARDSLATAITDNVGE